MDKKLKDNLEKLLSNVLDYTITEILDILKHHINQDVYSPNKGQYKRTYDFLRAWITSGQGNIKELQRVIEYDWQSMRYQSMGSEQPYQNSSQYTYHGSPAPEKKDERKELAQWLSEGSIGINTEENGSYWEHALQEIEKEIQGIIIDAFNKYGVKVNIK